MNQLIHILFKTRVKKQDDGGNQALAEGAKICWEDMQISVASA